MIWEKFQEGLVAPAQFVYIVRPKISKLLRPWPAGWKVQPVEPTDGQGAYA